MSLFSNVLHLPAESHLGELAMPVLGVKKFLGPVNAGLATNSGVVSLVFCCVCNYNLVLVLVPLFP